MIRRIVCLLTLGVLTAVGCHAQKNAYLRKLTDGIRQIRQAKASRETLNKTVIEWSATGCPKLTLMDDIERSREHEFRGQDANKFKMNQVVTYVYSRQNTGMVSKGDYFSSTEKDVFYSAIEKNIRKGQTASYTLTGHVGEQEFVFAAFNPTTKFNATVNGQKATPSGDGTLSIILPRVEKQDTIRFSIANESDTDESFVILNHNPQK